MDVKESFPATTQRKKCAKFLRDIVTLIGGYTFFLLLSALFLAIAEYAETCQSKTIWSMLLSLSIYFIYRKVYKPSPHVTFRTGFLDLAFGFCVGLCNLLLVVLCLAATGGYKIANISWDYPQVISNLSFFFLVAVSEEVICRGIILKTITQKWSLKAGIIISSVVFGIGHLLNDNATIYSTIILILDGFIFAYAFMFHNTLWLPIGMHWSWNFYQGTVLGFNVSGNTNLYSIINPIIGGNEIITGGSFGIEGSIFMLPISLLFIAFFYHLYKQNKVAVSSFDDGNQSVSL